MLDPSNIPPHFFPLPEGHVLLGAGGSIPNGPRYIDEMVAIMDYTDDAWEERYGYCVDEDDGLCYAVPMDHPSVDANRELVESLNPSVVFPWMTPVTAPATREFHVIPQDHAIRRNLTRDHLRGYVLVGHADDVEWIPGMNLTGMRYTALTGAWINHASPEFMPSGAIAVPMGHPLLDANRALAEANNPGMAFPWMGVDADPATPSESEAMPLSWTPERELPPNLPPIPEGCVLLGWGSNTIGTTNDDGFILRNAGTMRANWDRPNNYWTQDRTFCFAYPADSAIALHNPEVVAYYQNLLSTQPAPPPPSFRPLPDNLPPCPEGLVIVGWGDAYECRVRRADRAWITEGAREWSSPAQNSLDTGPTYHQQIHAWAPDSEVAREYAEAVAFYNPHLAMPTPTTPISVADPASQGVPLESWMPPLPMGAVHIGRGGSFERNGHFEGWGITRDEPRWTSGGMLRGSYDTHWYAVRHDSPMLDLNPSILSAPIPIIEIAPKPYGKRQWLLTLNGAPVASLTELENLCSTLISKPENLTPLTDCLWRALEYDDPEERLGDWATKEPVLLMVDFLPDKSEGDSLMPAVIDSSKSIGEIITTAAAGVLLRGGLSNHFHYTEEGRLVINPASPPSLDQGCEILRRTLEVRETGQKLDNYSAWTLGMLGDELERFFGDTFDPSLVMQATGRCYNTYITSLKVYRELWANRRNLSFTHHKEALYAKVTPDDTTFILDTADRLRLSVAQQRKLTSFVRLYGSTSFAEEPPDDAEALMERLEVKSVNKNYLFFLRSENKWFKYRGPFEHIPNGASPVINADTRAMLDSTGQPTEMAEWTPVGVEIPYVRGHSATLEAHRAEALPGDDEVEPSHGGNTDRLDEIESTQVAEDLVEALEESVQ